MLRYLLLVILVIFTQIIGIIMWGEYVWLFKQSNGGVGGSILEQINPIFWVIIATETIILLLLFTFIKSKKR